MHIFNKYISSMAPGARAAENKGAPKAPVTQNKQEETPNKSRTTAERLQDKPKPRPPTNRVAAGERRLRESLAIPHAHR